MTNTQNADEILRSQRATIHALEGTVRRLEAALTERTQRVTALELALAERTLSYWLQKADTFIDEATRRNNAVGARIAALTKKAEVPHGE